MPYKTPEEVEKLKDKLADILNALPDIDPHDDEAWMTDKCFPKFKKFVDELEASLRSQDKQSLLEEIDGMKTKVRSQAYSEYERGESVGYNAALLDLKAKINK